MEQPAPEAAGCAGRGGAGAWGVPDAARLAAERRPGPGPGPRRAPEADRHPRRRQTLSSIASFREHHTVDFTLPARGCQGPEPLSSKIDTHGTTTLSTVALAAVFCAAACSTRPVPHPAADTSTPPVEVTETFDGQLTINGGVSHPFPVSGSGAVTVDADGRWTPPTPPSGSASAPGTTPATCARPSSPTTPRPGARRLIGTASVVGDFCVRVYDVGKLSRAILYTLNVTHF